MSYSVAEMSRPYCSFKEQDRQDRSKVGRPQIHEYKSAVLINWMSPLLWTTISRVATCLGPQMSPLEIVHELKKINSFQFAKLAPQTLGAWIDRSGTVARWSDRTLERVTSRNRPGGLTTHIGVLVCLGSFFILIY